MRTILIVDDEEDLREYIQSILQKQKFNVLVAGSGKEAKEILNNSHNVDLVLSDVAMPDGSGLDLARFLKEHHPKTKIVLVTAYDNVFDDSEDNPYKIADGLLQKPFTKESLLETIKKFL